MISDTDHGFPGHHVNLGGETSRYISVKANNIKISFNSDGEWTRENNYYDLKSCAASYFENTTFEVKYYETIVSYDSGIYCLDESEVYL